MARTITITVEARSFFEVNTLELHDEKEKEQEEEEGIEELEEDEIACLLLVLDFERSEVLDEVNTGANIFDMTLGEEHEERRAKRRFFFDEYETSTTCLVDSKLILDIARSKTGTTKIKNQRTKGKGFSQASKLFNSLFTYKNAIRINLCIGEN